MGKIKRRGKTVKNNFFSENLKMLTVHIIVFTCPNIIIFDKDDSFHMTEHYQTMIDHCEAQRLVKTGTNFSVPKLQ